jgi:hypothetical protein
MNITDGDWVLSDADDDEYLPGNGRPPQKRVRRQEKYCCASFCAASGDSSKLFTVPKTQADRNAILKYLKCGDAYIIKSAPKELHACKHHFKCVSQTAKNRPFSVVFFDSEDERYAKDPTLRIAMVVEEEVVAAPALATTPKAAVTPTSVFLRQDVVANDPEFQRRLQKADPSSSTEKKRIRAEERDETAFIRKFQNADPLKLGRDLELLEKRLYYVKLCVVLKTKEPWFLYLIIVQIGTTKFILLFP